jgi:hypothetical protein
VFFRFAGAMRNKHCIQVVRLPRHCAACRCPEPSVEYRQINQIWLDLSAFSGVPIDKETEAPRLLRESLSVEDTPMSNEREGSGEDNRAIAEKIRQLARQTQIAQIQQELFDLADRLERMGEGDGTTSSGKS